MRSRALRILVFLLLGAIVNIAVAWTASNAWGEKRDITRRYGDGTVEHVSFPADLRQGWPLPALLAEVPTPGGGATVYTIELTNRIELALSPIWPDFAINTMLYAAILWLLFAAPFALRRRMRIKRGLCPKCAYDLRGSAAGSTACPECGSLRPEEALDCSHGWSEPQASATRGDGDRELPAPTGAEETPDEPRMR